MKTFKQHMTEANEVHPELAKHGLDHDAVKKFVHMQKSELDNSGLESRGEKMKATRAKNAFFNHLDKIHKGDEKAIRVAHHKISTHYDAHGEKGMYK